MIGGFYFFIDFLHHAARAWATLKMVGAISQTRWERRTASLLRGLSIVAVAGLNTYNDVLIDLRDRSQFSNVMMLELVILLAFAGALIFRCRWPDAFWLGAWLWMGLALGDFFVQTVVYMLMAEAGHPSNCLMIVSGYRGIYLLLWTAAILWLGRFLSGWMSGRGEEIRRYRLPGLLLVPLLFVCLVYFQRIYLEVMSEQLISHWFIFLLGMLLGGMLFLFYTVKRRAEEQSRLWEMQVQMLEGSYRDLQQSYEEKTLLMHDMKNHLLTLRMLAEAGDRDEISAYIDQIAGSLCREGSGIRTGHRLLDLVLDTKLRQAREAGVDVRGEYDDLSGLLLLPADICALFSNLLDNAIEANAKRKPGQERWIRLSCQKKDRMLLVAISNPLGERVVLKEGLDPESTKVDKALHGFGMRSIRRVVSRYGGHMKIDAKEEVFAVKLYLTGFGEEVSGLAGKF